MSQVYIRMFSHEYKGIIQKMFAVVNSFLHKPGVFSQKLFRSKSICSRAQILDTPLFQLYDYNARKFKVINHKTAV